jgi:hypothetical protein
MLPTFKKVAPREGRASFDLGLLVEGMLPVPLAVLHKLKLFLHSLAILRRCVIAALALSALQRDYLYCLFLSGHCFILSRRNKTFSAP